MFTTENKSGKWWVVEKYTDPAYYQCSLVATCIGEITAFKEQFCGCYQEYLKNRKQYPTLPEDASHWAALEGKMFGDGEFSFAVKETAMYEDSDGVSFGASDLYAIPKQAEERGEVKICPDTQQPCKEHERACGAICMELYRKQSQPAIPASDEDWADTEIEFQKTKPDWRKYSRELYMEYYIEFIHANYHPPKRKQ